MKSVGHSKVCKAEQSARHRQRLVRAIERLVRAIEVKDENDKTILGLGECVGSHYSVPEKKQLTNGGI